MMGLSLPGPLGFSFLEFGGPRLPSIPSFRRYGLPLVPGEFFEHSQDTVFVLAGHGRPLLRCKHSSHGISYPTETLHVALGLDPDAVRIQARRRLPPRTVDGPRDGLVEVRLPPVERKPTREHPSGITLGFEGASRATVWDYEDLGDGLFGSAPDLCVGVVARLELPPLSWL
ncbi:MAG TPA: hypothetical protein QGF58_21865 [Myxococcota bacterium]|nr:hypothetical protein [Myxococcota bacterium]